ncbi:DUF3016 domain-containing protein [Ideonella sp. DXS22W]|uniref:DUF3016 domain-containing protein n=1 Tax=Pseudaquabacterium inlustre TaxID=2984192 RepID=A0ABU9CHN5_9BURK
MCMPKPKSAAALAALLFTLAAGLARAGSVDVSYIAPERHADAGRGLDAERVRDDLTRLFQSLGASLLPADQALHIEVLDIDLAGELLPMYRTMQEVRVLRGRADWPRLQLRWTLSRGEQVIDSGSATVSDMAYLDHGDRHADGPLPYETRMLTQWFRARFAPQSPTR